MVTFGDMTLSEDQLLDNLQQVIYLPIYSFIYLSIYLLIYLSTICKGSGYLDEGGEGRMEQHKVYGVEGKPIYRCASLPVSWLVVWWGGGVVVGGLVDE